MILPGFTAARIARGDRFSSNAFPRAEHSSWSETPSSAPSRTVNEAMHDDRTGGRSYRSRALRSAFLHEVVSHL